MKKLFWMFVGAMFTTGVIGCEDGRGDSAIKVESESLALDSNPNGISGSVMAEVTSHLSAPQCFGGSYEMTPLEDAYVTLDSGGTAITDELGKFSIDLSGNDTVNSDIAGPYFRVIDHSELGELDVVSKSVAISDMVELVHPELSQFIEDEKEKNRMLLRAKYNAFKAVSDIRNMVLDYVPDFHAIADERSFKINVNIPEAACDTPAWYANGSLNNLSINFCEQTEEHVNMAYSTAVHHEYAHHINHMAGSLPGPYDEGMADAIAMLFTKSSLIALGADYDCDKPLRNAAPEQKCLYDETNCSRCEPWVADEDCVECGSKPGQCNKVLSGAIRDIWTNLETTHPDEAEQLIKSLVLNANMLHRGGAIDHNVPLYMLIVDDRGEGGDGFLGNGTPHYDEICNGFAAHGLNCPPRLTGLGMVGGPLEFGPDGDSLKANIPYTLYNLNPSQSIDYSITMPEMPWLTIDSGSSTGTIEAGKTVTLSFDVDTRGLQDMDYSGFINISPQPSNLTSNTIPVSLRLGLSPIFEERFDAGLGGFVQGEIPTPWHRSTDDTCLDGLEGHTSGGSLYFGVEGACHYATSEIAETMTMMSPTIAVNHPDRVELGFKYYLDVDDSPMSDRASVSIVFPDNSEKIVASNKQGGEMLSQTVVSGWKTSRIDISSLLPQEGPSDIRIKFSFLVNSPWENDTQGFAVDDVVVYAKTDESELQAIANGVTEDRLEAFVEELTGLVPVYTLENEEYRLNTRLTSSEDAMEKATRYAYDFLNRQNLDVSYFPWTNGGVSGENVVAEKKGSIFPDEIVIISAHIDAIAFRSAAPGADDNATGVATALLTASLMKDRSFDRTIRFVIFTGEEQGKLGSAVYADAVREEGENIVGVINVDMIGWDENEDGRMLLYVRQEDGNGRNADVDLALSFAQTIADLDLSDMLEYAIADDEVGASDQMSFWDNDYPAILVVEDILDDRNPGYHSFMDTIDQLDMTYFTNIAKVSAGTVVRLATDVGIKGDVNHDGMVNIVDALITAQAYVGLDPHPFDLSKADVNCDGSVNIVDALTIAQYYVGLIPDFPC